ncbi:carboxypeptidase-like regulatory domain-containing protein [Dyadobacter fermentans]|uniref:carboxypeptidase-like regulatory domain-containing protein n=1 Tax=Dyadobacter fermentans TaxID=94254 RepID=UPI001E38CCED|nr:carboxypeptidase-like regulatory domain-containing protein [Dyadobacter fermentans]
MHGGGITISGTVRDDANGELLIGASISAGKVSTLTNSYGFFSLTVPDSTSTVMIRHLGYQPLILDTLNQRRMPIDIRLVRSENRLAELTVIDHRLEDNSVGKFSLQMDKVRTTPALLGEADIMKVLALTPGVSAGVEGSAGLYVRGGDS